MKQKVFTLAFAVITLLGFNYCQAKNDNIKGTETPAKTEIQAEEGGSVKLTKETFLKEIWDYENSPNEWKYKGNLPAVIDFYADWCGPCKKAAPILEEISKVYSGKIKVYKVDTQVERELAGIFRVSSIPAFLYIPMEGKPTMATGTGRTDEDTRNRFEEIINKVLLASNE